ncbi:MAG: anti-sigma factor antagonist [Lachnospiraceae bacterium]|nr:anti-sigma factor antagonist [Lachnospiraceae bacterium]
MEEFHVIDNCLMVRLPEEIDHHRAGYIAEQADCYIAQNAVEHVVFDFEDTKFMDSSGIGIIAGRYKQISCLGGKVYAIHVNRQIGRMLHMSGISSLVDIR